MSAVGKAITLCECGCGQAAPIAAYTWAARGWRKGEPLRFIRGHNRRLDPLLDPSPVDYVISDGGCWCWRGRTQEGYGRVNRKGPEQLAHRWYYERLVGPIPEGHHLHHTCETPACVNPAHLEPLTPAEHKKRHAKVAVP